MLHLYCTRRRMEIQIHDAKTTCMRLENSFHGRKKTFTDRADLMEKVTKRRLIKNKRSVQSQRQEDTREEKEIVRKVYRQPSGRMETYEEEDRAEAVGEIIGAPIWRKSHIGPRFLNSLDPTNRIAPMVSHAPWRSRQNHLGETEFLWTRVQQNIMNYEMDVSDLPIVTLSKDTQACQESKLFLMEPMIQREVKGSLACVKGYLVHHCGRDSRLLMGWLQISRSHFFKTRDTRIRDVVCRQETMWDSDSASNRIGTMEAVSGRPFYAHDKVFTTIECNAKRAVIQALKEDFVWIFLKLRVIGLS
ncbi:hypothetical protein RRG08_016301 [Elysia crispata]|uniref:Uncharacterized protein n=1 Tax=Elysia crispata TaxID=231223 RepID=A0AAE1DMG7_9GAST|nr:hypothetical protein RRG08_016301 [Elysia crispata]